jgi:hypothetical protein
MGSNRTTFEKQQRDRAKKAKAAAKRDRRQGRAEDDPEYRPSAPAGPPAPPSVGAIRGEVSAAQLLVLVESLHKRFENEEISFEEFEAEKAELFSLLSVD